MQYGVYLFDFDGTLCDTRESLLPVFRAGYALVGREVTQEEVAVWMHYTLNQSMAMSGVAEEFHPTILKGIIDALDMPESIALIKAFPEAFDVMKTLAKQGKKIGIVSNNTSTHIRLVLEQLGYDGPLDCVVGSDMFSHGKPHPEPIEIALRILGEQPSEKACYVGDSLQDPECGINAGIGGVLVDRENENPHYQGVKIASLLDLLS